MLLQLLYNHTNSNMGETKFTLHYTDIDCTDFNSVYTETFVQRLKSHLSAATASEDSV